MEKVEEQPNIATNKWGVRVATNMLPGVSVRDVKKSIDERGFFAEVLRTDWNDLVADDSIAQVNLSKSLPGIIRAWHRHSRGQIDYMIVLRGIVKICAYDDEERSQTRGQLEEIIASEDKLQLVRVPGHYWHGTKTLGHEPSLTLYLENRVYDAKDPDEERRSWNDPSFVDPQTSRSYDWNKLAHK